MHDNLREDSSQNTTKLISFAMFIDDFQFRYDHTEGKKDEADVEDFLPRPYFVQIAEDETEKSAEDHCQDFNLKKILIDQDGLLFNSQTIWSVSLVDEVNRY